jgi:hypothetical protein
LVLVHCRAYSSGVSPPTAEWGRWALVLDAPGFDKDLGFGEGAELLDVEQFVARGSSARQKALL